MLSGTDVHDDLSNATTAEYPVACTPRNARPKTAPSSGEQPFIALHYDLFGELAHSRGGGMIHLARERATGRLVGLEIDAHESRALGDRDRMPPRVAFAIEPSDLRIERCLTCGNVAGAGVHICARCGSGVVRNAGDLGHSRAELLHAVRQQATRLDVLGDVDLGADEGIVYLARHRVNERLIAVRLEREDGSEEDGYVLNTVPLSRVAALLIDDRALQPDDMRDVHASHNADADPNVDRAAMMERILEASVCFFPGPDWTEPTPVPSVPTTSEAATDAGATTANEEIVEPTAPPADAAITVPCADMPGHDADLQLPARGVGTVPRMRAAVRSMVTSTAAAARAKQQTITHAIARTARRHAAYVAARTSGAWDTLRASVVRNGIERSRTVAIVTVATTLLWLGYLNGRAPANASRQLRGSVSEQSALANLPATPAAPDGQPVPPITTPIVAPPNTATSSDAGVAAATPDAAGSPKTDDRAPQRAESAGKKQQDADERTEAATAASNESSELSCTAAYDARKWSVAAAMCRRDADGGDAEAQQRMGLLFATGNGVRKDAIAAADWLTRAAERGNDEAAYQLVRLSRSDRTGAPNDDHLIELLTRAARSGHVGAQRELGMHYAEGRSVAKDRAAALTWFETAARSGDAESQYRVAWLLETAPRPTAQDDAAAVQWLLRAAEQEHLQAQYYLGFMSAQGRGMERSDSVATAWWKKAAARGHEDARRVLGEREK